METNTQIEADQVAKLNDLLQLDHDAVQAYTVAIENVEREDFRDALIRFRGDHQSHIENLTGLIRSHGGIPVELPHVPTGVFKLAVQEAGRVGGDKALLLAFKSNEGQVREKYARLAERTPESRDRQVLMSNAADEELHYRWVSDALERMGVGPDTMTGKAEQAFEKVHGGAGDMIEGVERKAMEAGERGRRELLDLTRRKRDQARARLDRVETGARNHPITTILAVAGAGLLLARLLR